MKKIPTEQEAIIKAKEITEEKTGYYDKRRWKEPKIQSYETEDYNIELSVMTGSPAKGYIINNRGTKTIQIFIFQDRKVKTIKYQ